MTLDEMARSLRLQYEGAKRNEATLAIHLFGIDHAEEIREKGYLAKDIVERAGIVKGYASELSKGIKLSDYVVRKPKEEEKHG